MLPRESSSNRKERVSDEPCSDQDGKHRSKNSIGKAVATFGFVHMVAIAWPGATNGTPSRGEFPTGCLLLANPQADANM